MLVRIALACCLILAACISPADYSTARAAVDRFHERLGRSEFAEIVDTASERLTVGSDRTTVIAFLEQAGPHLRSCSEVSVTSVNFRTATWGTFVTITTACSGGNATEEFVWEMKQGAAKLAGYKCTYDKNDRSPGPGDPL